MEIIQGKEADYKNELSRIKKLEPYSKASFMYGIALANALEDNQIIKLKMKPKKSIKKCMEIADKQQNISANQHDNAILFLRKYWAYGSLLINL